MTIADGIWLNIPKIHPTKKDMETLELQRALKFEYIQHPPWILGLYWYSLNARQYSKNRAVYTTRIVLSIMVTKRLYTSNGRRERIRIPKNVILLAIYEETDIYNRYITDTIVWRGKLQKRMENVIPPHSRIHEDWNYLYLDIHSHYYYYVCTLDGRKYIYAGWWCCLQTPHNKLCQAAA